MSVSLTGSNSRLNYGSEYANLRVREITYDYALNATESQGAYDRTFYPHRRSQGTFSLVIECNGYAEYRNVMNWLMGYFKACEKAALSDSQPPGMNVSVPARNFSRVGILTSGNDHEDHVGEALFKRTLKFVSISDPADPKTSILKASQASQFEGATYDPLVSSFFYPVSTDGASKDADLYDVPPAAPVLIPNPNQGQTSRPGF